TQIRSRDAVKPAFSRRASGAHSDAISPRPGSPRGASFSGVRAHKDDARLGLAGLKSTVHEGVMTLSIAIAGAAGRMGRALIRAACADPRFSVAGGTERSEGQFLGADLGALAGISPLFMMTTEV